MWLDEGEGIGQIGVGKIYLPLSSFTSSLFVSAYRIQRSCRGSHGEIHGWKTYFAFRRER